METVLELEIGPGPEPGTYVVDVLRSLGGGEPRSTITLDLDELVDRRGDFEASVLASAVAARRVMTDTEAAIQKVGRKLFESVFVGEVQNAYRTSVAVASDRGKDVQLVLRIRAPGLAALPWEALYDPASGTYLCRKDPLVRHVPAAHSAHSLAIEPPLRVLAMVASPRGLPPLDVERERELLSNALRTHIDAGRVEIEWVTDVTWAAVHDKLLEHEWHVLHFIGHGNFDTQTDEGVLAFVDDRGRADYVSASSLADLLDEAEPTPRLVLLNSCRSGAGGTDDLFSGTAAALAHSGIHAVAAMQFSISDNAAIQFSRGFYSALAHGRGIDEAVRSGRIGILGTGRGTLEWVTPVLYLRGEDTRLFEIAPTAVPPKPVKQPERMARPEPKPQPEPKPKPAPALDPVPTAPAASPPVAPPRTPVPAPPTTPPRPIAAAVRPDPRPEPAGAAPSARRRMPRWLPWAVVASLGCAAVGFAAVVVVPVLSGSTSLEEVLVPGPFGGDGDAGEQDEPVAADLPNRPPDAELAVPADQQWTETSLRCVAGDEFEFAATGELRWDGTDASLVGPEGGGSAPVGPADTIPGAALVAGLVYHADERHAVEVHSSYTCPNAGTLYVGINDYETADNAGGFEVRIWKHPVQ